MKIIWLDEDEMYDRLGVPYNYPLPEDESEPSSFKDEWFRARDLVNDFLSRYGQEDDYGQEDYTISDTSSESRGIGIEITSNKLLTPVLIEGSQKIIRTFRNDYELDYAIYTEDGVYHVFVNANEVRCYCPPDVAKKLGLS